MKRPNVVLNLTERQNAHIISLWNRAIRADSGLLLAQLDLNSGKMKVAAFSFTESRILSIAFWLVGTLRGFERPDGKALFLAYEKDGEEA